MINGMDYIRWNLSGKDDACDASAKRSEKSTPFSNKHQVQIEDIICNPKNPINPDSKLSVVGKFHI
jgi:hypothetical protein